MKTAVITGASGDIGRAICCCFLNDGYNVVACYNQNEESAKSLEEYAVKSRLICVKADLSVQSDVKGIFAAAEKEFGSVDVLVNNAAISMHGLFQDTTADELARLIDVNIKGVFYASQEAVRLMLCRHSGSIVNIASMWGEVGSSTEVAYSMTKSAVIGLTKALAKEVGPSGIRVNCVSPGLIDTKMNSCYTGEELDVICDETPLMRIGTPQDVANAVKYLAGEAASFVTGQILGVNGGYVI